MAKLDEIIANKKDYPDDQTISIGGVEVTLGEIRGGYLKDADYRKKTTELSHQREEFYRDYAAKTAALAQAQKQLEALAQAAARQSPQSTTDEIEEEIHRNPIAQRLVGKIQELEQVLVPMAKALVAMDAQMKNAAVAATAQYHQRVLADIVTKDPSVKPEELVEYARTNQIPNLYLAYRDMTRDRAIEAAKEEARKAALEEGKLLGKKEAMAPIIPARHATPKPPTEKILSLEEAAEAAKQDMDVMGPLLGMTPSA